jgi:hypothetical protein
MVEDVDELRRLSHAFGNGLADFDVGLAARDRTEIAADLRGRVTALGADFGWTRAIEVRLAPISLPRVRPFPPTNHRHG